MSLTKQSKKHLFNVSDVLKALDKKDKDINKYAFICPSKHEAVMCRNNVRNIVLKGTLSHQFTASVMNSVNLEGDVTWFCVINLVD